MERTARETEPQAVAKEPELLAHPGPRQYVMVAIALGIATAIEVAWYYASVPHPLFVALLLFLSFIKFSLVVLWFMHLRFDSLIFRRLFATGLALALSVYLIVLVIFGALKAPWLLIVAFFLIVLPVGALILRMRQGGVGQPASRELAGPGSSGHG
ncbi:MAG TPA: cytochrome C oxidase subunit IV family protein [Actinomycetota bacterium]